MTNESGFFDPSGKAVEERLREGRKSADRIKNKTAPKSGYLDTQLFPGKKEPRPYVKDYNFQDSLSTKKKV